MWMYYIKVFYCRTGYLDWGKTYLSTVDFRVKARCHLSNSPTYRHKRAANSSRFRIHCIKSCLNQKKYCTTYSYPSKHTLLPSALLTAFWPEKIANQVIFAASISFWKDLMFRNFCDQNFILGADGSIIILQYFQIEFRP